MIRNEITHNIFYDKYQDKEIFYVVFPPDTVFPPEVEIQEVQKDGMMIDYTQEEENEWVDEILRIIEGGIEND